jgi:hypothetical protein
MRGEKREIKFIIIIIIRNAMLLHSRYLKEPVTNLLRMILCNNFLIFFLDLEKKTTHWTSDEKPSSVP